MAASDSRAQLFLDVSDRATTDRVFRARLLVEPNAAIFDAFGVRVPQGFRLRFIEKGAEFDALVVLPDMASPDGALGDDDLDAVAGGGGEATGDGWW